MKTEADLPSEHPSTVHRARARVTGLVEAASAWVQGTIFWAMWERLLENEFIDRSVALAAKAFVSLFPSLIVVASFMPHRARESMLRAITRRAGLTGEGLNIVRSAFATSDDVRRATGVLGLLFTFFYVNSFVTALQRVFTRAWRRPAGGRLSGYALGVAWLIGVVAYFGLIGGARAVLSGGARTGAFAVLALVATMAIWTLTPWFMLQRQLRFRALVPTGVLTGLGMGIYGATSSIWMPNTVSQNQHQFGFFGVAIALVTWLTGAGTIIVVAACVGPVLAADTGPIGRLARGRHPDVLVPGAAPFLPAPIRPARLSSAFGLQRGDTEATPERPADDVERETG